MAKEDLLERDGVVNEVRPDSRYCVTLDNGVVVGAYAYGRIASTSVKETASRLNCRSTISRKDASTFVMRTNAIPARHAWPRFANVDVARAGPHTPAVQEPCSASDAQRMQVEQGMRVETFAVQMADWA